MLKETCGETRSHGVFPLVFSARSVRDSVVQESVQLVLDYYTILQGRLTPIHALESAFYAISGEAICVNMNNVIAA